MVHRKSWVVFLALLAPSVMAQSIRVPGYVQYDSTGTPDNAVNAVRVWSTGDTLYAITSDSTIVRIAPSSSTGGSGDMLKSVYDTDNNGIVDTVDNAPAGAATDTTSLSLRIDAKLSATDTASLSSRINTKLTGADTASLSGRIDLKVTRADTASWLPTWSDIDAKGYLDWADTANGATNLATQGDITRAAIDSTWSVVTAEDSLYVGDKKFIVNGVGTLKKVGNSNTAGTIGVPLILGISSADNTDTNIDGEGIGDDSGFYLLLWWVQPNGDGSGSYDFYVDYDDPVSDVVLATVDMSGTTASHGVHYLTARVAATLNFYPSADGTASWRWTLVSFYQ